MTDEEAVLEAFGALDAACEGTEPSALLDLFSDDPDTTFWGSAISEEAIGQDQLRGLAAAIVAAPGSFRITWTQRRVKVVGGVGWVNAARHDARTPPPPAASPQHTPTHQPPR
jgi:SnoaL-like domain